MAKWGEGDPRWICEERADATNVNNWHWSEKNAASWSRTKLKELLVGLVVENDLFSCKFKSITKCEGEASANNRKSKLIFFYEWIIEGEWEGVVKSDPSKVYKGTYDIPNLSEEFDASEIDVNITLKDARKDDLKDFVRKDACEKIKQQIGKYISSLKEEFSQGLIKPTAQVNSVKKVEKKIAPAAQETTKKTNDVSSEVGVKIPTTSLKMKEEFKCRVNELYNVFVDTGMVRAFTNNAVVTYEAEKHGKFALFDSNISGTFIELTPNKRITMNWRNKRWPEEHYSIVTLEFTEKSDCSEISLNHLAIPQAFLENTEEGWKRFYWNAIRQTFGYGSGIF